MGESRTPPSYSFETPSSEFIFLLLGWLASLLRDSSVNAPTLNPNSGVKGACTHGQLFFTLVLGI